LHEKVQIFEAAAGVRLPVSAYQDEVHFFFSQFTSILTDLPCEGMRRKSGRGARCTVVLHEKVQIFEAAVGVRLLVSAYDEEVHFFFSQLTSQFTSNLTDLPQKGIGGIKPTGCTVHRYTQYRITRSAEMQLLGVRLLAAALHGWIISQLFLATLG
jgi:hypothetical protein